MPRLLLNITHGFQARMLLRTAIADALTAGGAELIVVAPNTDEEYFRAEFDRAGFKLEPMPSRYSRIESAVMHLRAYLLMNPELGSTLNYKRERYLRNYPVRYWSLRTANLLFGRVRHVRRLYEAAETKLFDGSEFDALLRKHKPDLVITGTPGYNYHDAHLIRAAKRAGIPTATVMLSWDNLTSKGFMSAVPDALLVWSDLMRQEAIQYHGFSGSIVEVGAAQFDKYATISNNVDRADFRRRHGIPDGHRLVLWGTINQDIYPHQLQLLQRYVEHVKETGEPTFLWVRVHPQSVFGDHTKLLEEYRALSRPGVHVELPPVRSSRLAWDLPKNDLTHLAELLAVADVVVTPQSTLTIDAACAGTPVINLGIDDEIVRCFDYTHYLNITKHDAVWIVRSFPELLDAIDRYVADPHLHEEGRKAVVSEQLGPWYGRAGERTAQVLLGMASRPFENGQTP